jgi:hypothetical protein
MLAQSAQPQRERRRPSGDGVIAISRDQIAPRQDENNNRCWSRRRLHAE